ncbi:metallopeptidase [Paenibacillus swuensis]|uniref:Metallopeptidase n=1 Tax=Paenibacillus swuensis TaxID=1178515 RepID=A0A172TNK6_9BACL|nr:metallopeptidase [Paenibacillus swuensis]
MLDYLKGQNIDATLITSPLNVYYFTGFRCNPHERFLAYAVDGRTGEETLFVPLLDVEEAKAAGYVQRVVGISDTDNAYEVLSRELGKGVTRVGLEMNSVSLSKGELILQALPGAKFEDIEEFVLSLRVCKSPEEIIKVRTSIGVIEQVMEHAVARARVGMTEAELTAELEFQMKKLGASAPAFSTIVLTGARSALPHGSPGGAAIERDGFLIIDMGVVVDGYCSDITRTFLVGEGTKEQERIYEAVLAANRAGIAAVEVGKPIGILDAAARGEITERGFGEYFPHRVGHGFGMDVHEAPSIAGNNPLPMAEGMLFTIEPGVYVPGVGGVRIEDNIYIDIHGNPQVLTSFPKELRRLGV